MKLIHSTTVIGVRHNKKVAMGSDGQVSLEQTILKHSAKKIRRLYNNKVLAGFAGSAADGLTLFEKFEAKLGEYRGNLPRAAVELAKEWRTDKYLRQLEALLIVMDDEHSLIISGRGDVIEPDDGIATIGSGGAYALSAARALVKHSSLETSEIIKTSLEIASSICLDTNNHITIEEL